jgi:DNA-binding NarL/FixJ family response regulator
MCDDGGVPPTVLIVDDHSGFRSLVRKLLEVEGYIVVGEAEDGTSAIAAAITLKPELVLLDIQLPDHDGFEVTRQLRAHVPAPLIVLISSRDVCDYGRLLNADGVQGFICKSQLSGAVLAELLSTIGDEPR